MKVEVVTLAGGNVWHISEDGDAFGFGRITLCGKDIPNSVVAEQEDADHPRICGNCRRFLRRRDLRQLGKAAPRA